MALADLVLGVGETRLLDLTAAYSALARAGERRAPRLVRKVYGPRGEQLEWAAAPSRQAMSAEAAFLVAEALSDETARATTFRAYAPLGLPFRVALKTGTSGNARDLWAFGVQI
jgi:penicillin-binding protein 1C